jgi:hypothetical protein
MERRCEVCVNHPEAAKSRGKLRRVLVEMRVVALCEEHAEIVARSGVETLAELHALFPEPGGARSLIARRAPLDRRVFPPRPEGRRRNSGRRATDVEQ